MDPRYRENIQSGMKVAIVTSQQRIIQGVVESIAPRTDYHQKGIMVRLLSGEVGRVQKIISSTPLSIEKPVLEIKKMLTTGEDFYTEFKTAALWSTSLNPQQLKETKSPEVREYGTRASKVIIAKSIAAFLNSSGGNLIIGVKENKENSSYEVVGIEADIQKAKDQTQDGYKRTLIDEVLRTFFPPKIFNHLNQYIDIEFILIDAKTVCRISINKSDSRVFLKINDRDVFMIRVDSENRTLEGEKLVDYCIKKWGIR